MIASQIHNLKVKLTRWREITARDFPEMLSSIPQVIYISLEKLGDNWSVMTDTCNGAQKTNCLLVQSIEGTAHSMYCYNHLWNVWVKYVLNSWNDFMRGHLNDSLDEIAPELRVSPNFITFARAFDKEFSLCANYPKGHGGLWRRAVLMVIDT
jgi:hypothetical protein